jgi:hypothetical protein
MGSRSKERTFQVADRGADFLLIGYVFPQEIMKRRSEQTAAILGCARG